MLDINLSPRQFIAEWGDDLACEKIKYEAKENGYGEGGQGPSEQCQADQRQTET